MLSVARETDRQELVTVRGRLWHGHRTAIRTRSPWILLRPSTMCCRWSSADRAARRAGCPDPGGDRQRCPACRWGAEPHRAGARGVQPCSARRPAAPSTPPRPSGVTLSWSPPGSFRARRWSATRRRGTCHRPSRWVSDRRPAAGLDTWLTGVPLAGVACSGVTDLPSLLHQASAGRRRPPCDPGRSSGGAGGGFRCSLRPLRRAGRRPSPGAGRGRVGCRSVGRGHPERCGRGVTADPR